MIYIPKKLIRRQLATVVILGSLIAVLAGAGTDRGVVVGEIKALEQTEARQAFSPHRIIKNAVVYAYTSRVEETDSDPFTTASGEKVRKGIVANNCLAFGTEVDINGLTYTVKDRMNSRYGCNVFDVWHDDLVEARKWGKKTTDILVYVSEN